MTAATIGTAVSSGNANTQTNTSLSVALATTTVGQLNVVEISGDATGTGVVPSMNTPAGWTKLGEQVDTNTGTATSSSYVGVFYRVVQSGDGSSVNFTWANAGQMVAICTPWSGQDGTTPLPYWVSAEKVASDANYSIAGTTGTDQGFLCYGFANRSTTAWSSLSDTTRASKTVGVTMVGLVTSAEVTGGTAFTKTGVGTNTSVGVSWAYVVKGTTSSSPAAGSAALSLTAGGSALPTDGATAVLALTATGGTVTARPAGAAALTLTAGAETPAQSWVRQNAGGTQYVAHRDGLWGTYGEETLEGYTATAAYHSKLALEISVWDTSDGVYVCSHDSTTGRVFSGTNRTINSTTWATLSPNGASTVGRPTTLIGGNPMRRLEEILDAFPTRIFVVENKHGTNQATLAALLEAHAPGRWIFKGPYNDTANANTASAYHCPVWLFFYPADLTNLSTTYTALSTAIGNGSPIIFGLGDYSTAPVPVQSDATTFFAFTTGHGVKAWAHILGTSTHRTTADGQATTASTLFDGYMVSNVANVISSDATGTGSGTAALTLTAGGAGVGVAAASATLALTASGAPKASTGGSAALALTATGSAQSRATAAATLTITAAGSATAPTTSTGSLTLTATGTTGAVLPASGTASLTITVAGAVTPRAAASSVLTLTAGGAGGTLAAGLAALALAAFAAALTTSGGIASLTMTATGGAHGDRQSQDITVTAVLAVQVRPFTAALASGRKFTAELQEQPT